MPIFMDRHDVQSVTAEEVAMVHQEDLKIQDKYNCRALTYWFDKEREAAFCLIEAPDRKAVIKMHDEAHGLIPSRIIEVESKVVEAFLGRIRDPEPVGRVSDLDPPVFQDPAFRTIMVTELKDAALLLSGAGIARGREFLSTCNTIIKKSLKRHGGRVVKSTYDGFIVTFTSVSKSVECAFEIQKRLKEYKNHTIDINIPAGIGLNAGDPVTESGDFFGDAIQFAKRLCYISDDGQIKVSSNVRNQYKKEKLKVLSESKTLKPLNSKEEQFLNRLMNTTERIWNQERFNVKDFCSEIGVSKSQLYRKITGLTGHSPTEFIKEFRLKKAVKLIEKQPANIARVAFETGFNNPSYFTKCFKEKYDLLPSEYKNRMN